MQSHITTLKRKISLHTLALVAILLSGLALRLILFTGMARNDDLDMAHLAFDVLNGRFQITELLQQPFSEQGWRMAIYLPVAALYRIFGVSEATTLAYPLISSILGIYFVYLLGKLFGGPRVGLLAAFLWSAFPLDIHFATDLMPDGPMNAYGLGGAYFFFLALRAKEQKLTAKYALASFGLILWSILVKPWAITLALFLGFYLVILAFERSAFPGWWAERKQLQKRYLTLGAILLLGFLSWLYISNQPLDFLTEFWISSQDLALWLFGVRQDRFILDVQTSDLMLLWTPLFLVSIFWTFQNKHWHYRDILLWIAFLYIYIEWGPSRPSLRYNPIHPLAESRNFLLLMPPFILLAGAFLAEKLESLRTELWLIVLSLFLPVATFMAVANDFSLHVTQFLTLLFLVSLLGLAVLFRIADNRKTSQREPRLIAGIWLAFFALATLYPALPEHFTHPYLSNQRDLQVALKPIVSYLRIHDDYPIVAFSKDIGLNLNYMSNMDLGFNINNARGYDEDFRILLDEEAQLRNDSFYTVFYSDYHGPVPANWWKIAEHRENVPSPVFFYRALSPEDAQRELAQALALVDAQPSLENYTNLYGAAHNAVALPELMRAWQAIQALGGETPELQELMPLVEVWVSTHPEALSESLLPKQMNAATWEPSGDNVDIDIAHTELDQRVLEVAVQEKQGQPGAISTTLQLEPQTLYMGTIVLRTNTHTSIFNIDGGSIPDSDNANDVHSNRLTFTVIFLTPDWGSGSRPISLELVHNIVEGQVWIREASLVKVAYIFSESSE